MSRSLGASRSGPNNGLQPWHEFGVSVGEIRYFSLVLAAVAPPGWFSEGPPLAAQKAGPARGAA